MRTPYGFNCRYFHGDYHRGRHIEKCKLIGSESPPNHWTVDLCKTCPVPDILRANACSDMILNGEVKRFFLGMKRVVRVTAYCQKTKQPVSEPELGCGECHPIPTIFFFEDSNSNPEDD